MKLVHRLTAILLINTLLVMLTGCTGRLSTQKEKPEIKVIVKKSDFSFWMVVGMGAEAAGKEFGVDVDFNGPTGEYDIQGQIDMVNDAIDSGTDAIVLAASDYIKLVDAAERAVAEKIPVVIIDSGIKSDKMVSFVGTDNIDAGKKLGEILVERIGDSCNVAVMSFVKGAATCEEREEGLFKELQDNPGVKVLTTEYCSSDEDVAEKLTREIVDKYPEIDAIICLNEYGTIGAARSIDKLNLSEKVKIIGFDSSAEEISYMEKDVIQALVVQNPFSMGYLGVKYAVDAINKKEVPNRMNTGSTVIDKNNMYLPENQKLVFPFSDQ